MWLAKLVCKIKGHKRGRLVNETETLRTVSCPRCGRLVHYKKRTPSLPPVQS